MSMSLHGDTFNFARKYSEDFVETGSYVGGGLLGATYARFERLYTCDVSEDFLARAKANMGTQFGRIRYYLGSSGDCLPKMLGDAQGRRCSILLDAHVISGDRTSERAAEYVGTDCPLREELDAIAKHFRKDHLVMVDDIDLCGTHHLAGIGRAEVERRLLDINPDYTFRVWHGVRRDMLLMAVPPA